MTPTQELLFMQNTKLVGHTIKRYCLKYLKKCEFDDMMQVGYIGLMKAVERFNPEFGVKFSTYAVSIILGKIMLHLRDDCDTVRFSRLIKYLYLDIEEAGMLQSPIPEIMAKFKVTESKVRKVLLYAANLEIASIEEINPIGIENSSKSIRAFQLNVDFDTRLLLDTVYNKVNDLEKQVLEMTIAGYNRTEIAAALGYSQSYITRVLQTAQGKARRALAVSA